MKFNHTNCQPGTSVVDVDKRETLKMVMTINTETGEVECYHQPFDVFCQTYTIKFRSIYPIYGGSPVPGMFHCYGRLS